MAAQRDMTVGDPAKIVFSFSVPVILGNIFQQFYAMTDTVIVGQFVGTRALAAVGATGTITFLILGFTWGLCAGFTVPMGQRFGAGDIRGMKKAAGNALSLSLLFALIITVLSLLGMRRLLTVMNTPPDIFDMTYEYVVIICAGLFAQTLYTMLSTMMRTLGDSRDPLIFLVVSAGLNIVLDLLFIIPFGMGVAGAAWATVISQGVAGLCSLIFILIKMPILRLSRTDFLPDHDLIKAQLSLGIPMALQFSITAIGAMMLQSSLNLLGSTAVAAYTAGGKIEQLLDQLFIGLGVTMASYCSQNAGAGKPDRVKAGVLAADRQGFLCAAVSGISLLGFGKYLTYLFISEDIETILPMVSVYLRCCSFFLIPLAAIFIYRNALQGMGYSFMPLMAGVIELVARGAVAFAAGRSRSFLGVCFASPAAWVAAAVFLFFAYRSRMRKIEAMFRSSSERTGEAPAHQ
ncbi:MATE family efflux transporter [Lachnoclostridium sp. Marseille-P6806]|uniref:MATE family efflux transporter n=1 Tax=Lachnoclostridium sp. Marseille-P6806 TaxID=2364793 RepID=UPI001030F06A|nr:MATE family efflux transporter [Lachnoclostridium sp. Marseille-P6806]